MGLAGASILSSTVESQNTNARSRGHAMPALAYFYSSKVLEIKLY